MADDEIRSGSDSPDPSSPPPPGPTTATVPSTSPPSSSQRKDPVQALGGGGGRRLSGGVRGRKEDCWSERATDVLIDAWGEKYLALSRGNLKQKQWQEVAETVRMSEEDSGKTPKTDLQCKQRIDTVKKRYKLEKARLAHGGGGGGWVFYDKLDRLIGSTAKISSRDSVPPPPLSKRVKQGGGNTWRELSRAIMRFSEAYEEIENAKMRQVVEMEKERLRFLKELELQRIQFLGKIQLELSQLKEQGRRMGDTSNNEDNMNDNIVDDSNNDDEGH